MAAGVNLFEVVGVPHTHLPIAGGLLTAGVLTGLGLYVRTKLRRIDDHLLPEPRANILNMAVGLFAALRNMAHSIIGHGSDKFLPIIATIFLFILFSNLSGIVPGVTPATESLLTGLAVAAVVFVTYQYFGIREHGFGYLKHFTGGLPPKGFGVVMTIVLSAIACLLFVIEIVGHVFRPISLSFRLWGNINADHTLVGVFHGLIPLIIPIVFLAFGVFVSFIQAFVFSVLATVYYKLSVSHDH